MTEHCGLAGMAFGDAGGRTLVAAFDGGLVTSDAGALLLGGHDAGQPAAAVVRLDGLRAPVRLAPDRAGPHWACRRDLRHDPPQAPEDRRARALSMLWTDFCAGTPPGRLDPIRSAFSNTK